VGALQALQTCLAVFFVVDLGLRVFVRGSDFAGELILFGMPVRVLEVILTLGTLARGGFGLAWFGRRTKEMTPR
jgi:hypothetical protein